METFAAILHIIGAFLVAGAIIYANAQGYNEGFERGRREGEVNMLGRMLNQMDKNRR